MSQFRHVIWTEVLGHDQLLNCCLTVALFRSQSSSDHAKLQSRVANLHQSSWSTGSFTSWLSIAEGHALSIRSPDTMPSARRSKSCHHWTLKQWKIVLWHNKSHSSIRQSDGWVWVWTPNCFVPTVKFGGGRKTHYGRINRHIMNGCGFIMGCNKGSCRYNVYVSS